MGSFFLWGEAIGAYSSLLTCIANVYNTGMWNIPPCFMHAFGVLNLARGNFIFLPKTLSL
jgi:hypothetical protein